MNVTVRLALAFIVSAVLIKPVGCAPDRVPPSGVTVRDSAGIRIVENFAPVWSDTGGWRLDSIPTVEIGAGLGDATNELFRVRNVELLEDGHIMVANGGTAQLLVLDSAGNFVRTIGDRGEGPGEFWDVLGMYRCAGDTLVVNEGHRVSVLDPRGRFVRARRVDVSMGPGGSEIGAVSSDCSAVLLQFVSYDYPPQGRVGGIPSALIWTRLDDGLRDTVATFPALEVVGKVIQGRAVGVILPWGKDAIWAVGDDRVYLGLSDRFEIRVFQRLRGLVEIIRWAAEPEPVSGADRDLYARRRGRLVGNDRGAAEHFPELDDFPRLPTTHKPPIHVSSWMTKAMSGSGSIQRPRLGYHGSLAPSRATIRRCGRCSTRPGACSVKWRYQRSSRCTRYGAGTLLRSGRMRSTWSA
jgi:hypothetical protein